MGIVGKAEGANAEFLKRHYKEIENTQDWKSILEIQSAKTTMDRLRQDNHVRPDYTLAQLQKMSANAGTDLTALYDTSGYLSKLMLTAYELDDVFHDTLREVFDIDVATGRSSDGTILYFPGPVKGEDRAKAKAQSDYSDRPSPSTSCVIDFIRQVSPPLSLISIAPSSLSQTKHRCAMTFPTCTDLLASAKKLTQVIESKKTPIKEIIRIKNSLAKNEKKRVEEKVYRYGDVKMNVLVVGGRGKAMICEVQFLLQFMKDAKSQGHSLYEVSRREQFVSDVVASLTRSFDKNAALFTAAARGDSKEFIRLVVDFGREIKLTEPEKSGEGYYLSHRLAESGCYKSWRFLLSCVDEKGVGVLLSSAAANDDTCLVIASHKQTTVGHVKILKSIFSDKYRKHCNVNAGGMGGRCALYRAWLSLFNFSLFN